MLLCFWIYGSVARGIEGQWESYPCIMPRNPESVTIGVGFEFEDELGSQYTIWSFKNSGVSLSGDESSSWGNSTVACDFIKTYNRNRNNAAYFTRGHRSPNVSPDLTTFAFTNNFLEHSPPNTGSWASPRIQTDILSLCFCICQPQLRRHIPACWLVMLRRRRVN